MNKTSTILVTIVLTALIVGGVFYFWQKSQMDSLREEVESLQQEENAESTEINEVENETPATDTNEGFETYESDSLGLSFSYPSVTGGNKVTVEEALNADQNAEIGSVSLVSDGSVIASISIEWRDSPGATIEGILLGDSKTCSLEVAEEGSGKTVYSFKSSASPYGDDFDPNCQILAQVYAFTAQPNKFAVVSTGQTPPFSSEDTATFFDSIKLFQ